MKNKFEFFETEDEKYGGIEVDNFKEAMQYGRLHIVEDQRSFSKNKEEVDYNSKIESDYHNSYRGKRTLKSKNWDKVASKAMEKRMNEPEDTVFKKKGDLFLTDVGKKYYSKEIELNKTLAK